MTISDWEKKEVQKLLQKENRKSRKLVLASYDSFGEWLKKAALYLYEALFIAKTILEIYNTVRKLFR